MVGIAELVPGHAELRDRRVAQSRRHRGRHLAREDGRSRVALLLGRVPVLDEAGDLHLGLVLLGLGLLETDDVGIQFGDKGIEQPLLRYRSNAVDVP